MKARRPHAKSCVREVSPRTELAIGDSTEPEENAAYETLVGGVIDGDFKLLGAPIGVPTQETLARSWANMASGTGRVQRLLRASA